MALMYSFSFPYVCCITAAVPANPSTLVTVRTYNSFQQTEGTVGRKANGGRERTAVTTSCMVGLDEADPAWASSHVSLQPCFCPGRAAGSCPCRRRRGSAKAWFSLLQWDGGCEAGSQGGQLGCSPRWVPPWAAWRPCQQTRLPPPPETPRTLSRSPTHPGAARPWPSPHWDLGSRLLYSPLSWFQLG